MSKLSAFSDAPAPYMFPPIVIFEVWSLPILNVILAFTASSREPPFICFDIVPPVTFIVIFPFCSSVPTGDLYPPPYTSFVTLPVP